MREIKFRAWDTIGKEMYFNYPNRWGNMKVKEADGLMTMDLEQVVVGLNGTLYILDECGRYTYLREGEAVLMQFTGLKDKNGKEIYEGDIIGRYTPTSKLKDVFEIKWDDEPQGFYADEQPGWDGTVLGYSLLENWEALEVIGNIYENSELLK